MIKRIYILLIFFFFSVLSLSAQVEMKNFRVSKTSFTSDNHYTLLLKDSLRGPYVRSAWFGARTSEEYKLFSPLFIKIAELLEKEVYIKCDTNVNFIILITYNVDNEPYRVDYSVPEEYFHCFSESFFDEIYSLIWTMSADLPVNALLDLLWSRMSKSAREKSTAPTQVIFRLNKSRLDQIKNEYLKE